MEVVTLLLFVGAVWGVGAGVLFLFHIKTAGHQHADRLALLPLDDNWNDPCTSLEVRTSRVEKAHAQERTSTSP